MQHTDTGLTLKGKKTRKSKNFIHFHPDFQIQNRQNKYLEHLNQTSSGLKMYKQWSVECCVAQTLPKLVVGQRCSTHAVNERIQARCYNYTSLTCKNYILWMIICWAGDCGRKENRNKTKLFGNIWTTKMQKEWECACKLRGGCLKTP